MASIDKKVSMKDIARKVGVSTALVSYVLNGKEKEKRVGAEVVKRIKEVALELNYRPNQIARSLRQGTTKTIGFIMADIANPFFGNMARAVEDEANRLGFSVLFGSSDEDCNKLGVLINTLCNRQVDGIIIVPPEGSDEHIRELLKNDIPVILTDRYFTEQETSYVLLDNYSATFEATSYLIDKGYKRIGIVAYKSSLIHMQERILGYKEAMKARNMEKETFIEFVRISEQGYDMKKALQKLMSGNRKAEALIFATNSLSISGLYYLKDSGIVIPKDLAVIGFDGSEAFDFFYSPLTYISQPIEEMSKEAVRVLVDQINGSNKIVHIKLKHKFIIRKSC